MHKNKLNQLILIGSLIVTFSLGTLWKMNVVRANVYSPSTTDSEVFVTGGNGFGSVDTVMRRFSTVRVNIGNDITYTDDSSYGASFLINTAGIYSISYSDWRHDTTNTFYASSDIDAPASTPTSNGSTTDPSPVCTTNTGPTVIGSCSATVYLDKNDVVRAYWFGGGGFASGQSGNADSVSTFIVTRVK